MLPGVKDSAADVMLEVELQQIVCGDYHTVGVTPAGELFTWGHGAWGQLGHGNYDDLDKPKLVNCLAGMKMIHLACGSYHTAVVTSDGELYTWYVYNRIPC
jgi:alpha-tubulin suppressor-like RCC1 family protein